MKLFIRLILLVAALIFLGAPQARAGIDEADQDCRSNDFQRKLRGCTQLIEQYSHQYNQRNLAIIYYNRARAKWSEYGWDSAVDDYKRACDLGEGLGCCELSVSHFEDWIDFGGETDANEAERLVKRAEMLGADEEVCKEMFGDLGELFGK